jgi:predicted tellurium resistance membrane protein TerC
MDFSAFAEVSTWVSIFTLTFMEIVLGNDNIIFISIVANRLPEELQPKARNWGLVIAMVLRIVLLFGLSFVLKMQKPFLSFVAFGHEVDVTGQSIILLAGGIFLMYKSISEIHHKLEGDEELLNYKAKDAKLTNTILQITLINIVFSIDSIITAIGLTTIILVMMISVILSMIIMMLFSGQVGSFINRHPSMQMLGLSFLILIGFMLIMEGLHQMHVLGTKNPDEEIVPKGYLYFAIFFSLAVELLNIRFRTKIKKQ